MESNNQVNGSVNDERMEDVGEAVEGSMNEEHPRNIVRNSNNGANNDGTAAADDNDGVDGDGDGGGEESDDDSVDEELVVDGYNVIDDDDDDVTDDDETVGVDEDEDVEGGEAGQVSRQRETERETEPTYRTVTVHYYGGGVIPDEMIPEIRHLRIRKSIGGSEIGIRQLMGKLQHAPYFESVRFPSTLREIYDYTFWKCHYLTTVIFPKEFNPQYISLLSSSFSSSSIRTIGESAFCECTALQTIHLPQSVEVIKEQAFAGCTSLKRIDIPNSVTVIHEGTFAGCTSLHSVAFPPTLQEIQAKAFQDCEELDITRVPSTVWKLGNHAFKGCSMIGFFFVHSKLETIEESVFEKCTGLSTVFLPDSVEDIEMSAFEGCTSLQVIRLPKFLKKIGPSAFEGCSGLGTVAKSASPFVFFRYMDEEQRKGPIKMCGCGTLTGHEKIFSVPPLVREIGEAAFLGCSELTAIILPHSMSSIGPRAFALCSKVSMMTVPHGIRKIGYKTFCGCSALKVLFLPPDSLVEIEKFAFGRCESLKFVRLTPPPESTTTIVTTTTSTRTSTTSTTTMSMTTGEQDQGSLGTLPEDDDELSNRGINTLPDTLEILGQGAFHLCKSLTDMRIPALVRRLEEDTFSCCPELLLVSFDGPIQSIGKCAFYFCQKLNVCTLPDTVEEIGPQAFEYNLDLQHISLPSSPGSKLTHLPDNVFMKCGFTYIELPDTIQEIGRNAFKSCKALQSIQIHTTNLKHIKESAFEQCTSLRSVTFVPPVPSPSSSSTPSGATAIATTASGKTSLTKFSNRLFCHCEQLTSIVPSIPNSIREIGASCFAHCSNLTSITVPKSLRVIGTSAFDGCSALRTIHQHGQQQQQQEQQQQEVQGQQNNNADDNNNGVNNGNNEGHDNINEEGNNNRNHDHDNHKNIFPTTLRRIGRRAFYENGQLSNVYLPDNSYFHIIPQYAFYRCSSLKTVSLYKVASDSTRKRSASVPTRARIDTMTKKSLIRTEAVPKSSRLSSSSSTKAPTPAKTAQRLLISKSTRAATKNPIPSVSHLRKKNCHRSRNPLWVGRCAFDHCHQLQNVSFSGVDNARGDDGTMMIDTNRHNDDRYGHDVDNNHNNFIGTTNNHDDNNNSHEYHRRRLLARHQLDLIRGGQLFLQQHSSYNKKYPVSLWPIILYRANFGILYPTLDDDTARENDHNNNDDNDGGGAVGGDAGAENIVVAPGNNNVNVADGNNNAIEGNNNNDNVENGNGNNNNDGGGNDEDSDDEEYNETRQEERHNRELIVHCGKLQIRKYSVVYHLLLHGISGILQPRYFEQERQQQQSCHQKRRRGKCDDDSNSSKKMKKERNERQLEGGGSRDQSDGPRNRAASESTDTTMMTTGQGSNNNNERRVKKKKRKKRVVHVTQGQLEEMIRNVWTDELSTFLKEDVDELTGQDNCPYEYFSTSLDDILELSTKKQLKWLSLAKSARRNVRTYNESLVKERNFMSQWLLSSSQQS